MASLLVGLPCILQCVDQRASRLVGLPSFRQQGLLQKLVSMCMSIRRVGLPHCRASLLHSIWPPAWSGFPEACHKANQSGRRCRQPLLRRQSTSFLPTSHLFFPPLLFFLPFSIHSLPFRFISVHYLLSPFFLSFLHSHGAWISTRG